MASPNMIPGAKQVTDLVELRREVRDYDTSPYFSERLDAQGIVQARQLLAGIYLKNGAVQPSQLAENGTLNDANDPYWRTRSEYFGVRDKQDRKKLYTAHRLIECAPGEGVDSLQIHIDELEPKWQELLRQLRPDEVREVASLIKEPGVPSVAVLALIRETLHYSRENGIKYWVWGLHPKVAPKFTFQFGKAIVPLGGPVHLGHLKPTYLPYLVDVEQTWELVNQPRLHDRLVGRAALYEFLTKKPEPFMCEADVDDWPDAAQ